VFNGPLPVIWGYDDAAKEEAGVAGWLAERLSQEKMLPQEIGVFVRSGG